LKFENLDMSESDSEETPYAPVQCDALAITRDILSKLSAEDRYNLQGIVNVSAGRGLEELAGSIVNLSVFDEGFFDAEISADPRLLSTRPWFNYHARAVAKRVRQLLAFLKRNWAYLKGASMAAVEKKVYEMLEANNADKGKK
jgi:hypothetical protein